MFFRKKNFSLIALFVVALLFGGIGCKNKVTTQQKALVQPVKIEYWTVFNDVEELRKLASKYKQIRPYVTVDIRQIRVEEFDKLFVNSLADDIQPDVISVHSRWLKKYQSRLSPAPASVQVAQIIQTQGIKKETIIQPLRVAIPSKRDVQQQYVKTVGEDVIIEDDVYGLPLALDTLALYYNKDLLDASGVPLPPSTWGEILDTVKVVTKFAQDGSILQSTLPIGTGVNIDNSVDLLIMLLMQNGIEVTDGAQVSFADNLKDNIDNHPTRETLRFYTDFARRTKEAYTWDTNLGNALDVFIEGRSVFYVGYAFDQDRIKAGAPQMNLEVVPLPQLNPDQPVNVASYWVESVVKKSKNQDVAWDFVRFITDEKNVADYTKAAHRPTPFRSQITDQQEDPLLAPFVQGILTADNWYQGKDIDAANRIMKNLIDSFLDPYGEEEPPAERDARLIDNAASLLQQTM